MRVSFMKRSDMKEKPNAPLIRSEKGVAMVAVMLILLLLSLMAVTMTDTTISEKKMVRSEAVFEKSFFNAESAAFEGAQKLENEGDPNELLAPLVEADTSSDNYELLIAGNAEEPDNLEATLEDFRTDAADPPNAISGEFLVAKGLAEESEQDEDSYRLVVQQPIQSGDSLALGQSRLYSYKSYGLSETYGGRALIRLGYKKRF